MGHTSGALYIFHIKVKERVQNKDRAYLGSSLYTVMHIKVKETVQNKDRAYFGNSLYIAHQS